MKLIFIASLERSGSTILDISLSKYPNVISLGEVWRVIKPHGTGLDSVLALDCTCGHKGSQCPFWGAVLAALGKLDETATLVDRYRVFCEVARTHYGADVILVDSSKSIQALEALTRVESVNFQVISLVRDVRGWMNSIRKAEKRKREMSWGKIFEPDFRMFCLAYFRHNILRLLPFWLANEWMLRNIRLNRHVASTGFTRLDISYEELVFSTELTCKKIEKSLGINEIAKADDRFLPQEEEKIREILLSYLTVSQDDLPIILTAIRQAALARVDFYQFSRDVSKSLSHEAKVSIIEDLFFSSFQ